VPCLDEPRDRGYHASDLQNVRGAACSGDQLQGTDTAASLTYNMERYARFSVLSKCCNGDPRRGSREREAREQRWDIT
jgi:hypothetical protein